MSTTLTSCLRRALIACALVALPFGTVNAADDTTVLSFGEAFLGTYTEATINWTKGTVRSESSVLHTTQQKAKDAVDANLNTMRTKVQNEIAKRIPGNPAIGWSPITYEGGMIRTPDGTIFWRASGRQGGVIPLQPIPVPPPAPPGPN